MNELCSCFEYCAMNNLTVNMLGRGSPRLTMLFSKAAQKKNSPKAGPSKKHGGSPKGMQVVKFCSFTTLEFCNL